MSGRGQGSEVRGQRSETRVSGIVRHPSSVIRLLSSVLRPPSSVLCLLLVLAVTASAQTGPFDLPAGLPDSSVSAETQSLTPPGMPVTPAQPVVSQKEDKWEQELLRDPFWPVGFFPPNWQKRTEMQGVGDMDGSGWKTAAAKVRISGTSRLGGRTAAIINGELKSEGDPVEVLHEGRIYRWEIIGIDAAGQVQLKKLGIR